MRNNDNSLNILKTVSQRTLESIYLKGGSRYTGLIDAGLIINKVYRGFLFVLSIKYMTILIFF